MNLYQCHLNTGDRVLDGVQSLIKAKTRNQAKYILLMEINDAGWRFDWLTPVSIRIVRTNEQIDEQPGVLRYV